MLGFSLVGAVLLVGVPAFAGETGPVKVLGIGCHTVNSTCYVTVQNAVRPTGCPASTSLRWDRANVNNGQAVLSLLTAAFLAGKSVNFAITGCYGGYPTFDYFVVAP